MTRDLICGPKVTRRSFSTWLLLFAAGIPAFTMSGCNVLQDLIDYIPWIVRALQSIGTIVGPFMPTAGRHDSRHHHGSAHGPASSVRAVPRRPASSGQGKSAGGD